MSYITLAGGVSQITAGTAITIAPISGKGNVTVNNAGVTQIVAGAGIGVAPAGGTGVVTVSRTGAAFESPQRTFFVSPAFSGVSPFFTTIQAAINAADGVNVTLIYIYPAIYLEVLTMKNNVFLQGTDKHEVFIGDNASASIVLSVQTSCTWGIRDVTLTSTHATTTGISVTPQAGAVNILYLKDVDILLQFGNSCGIRYDNATAASNSHQLFFDNVNLNVNGSSAALYFSKAPNLHFINNCSFGGSAMAVNNDSVSGVFNQLTFTRCGFSSQPNMNGGSANNWFFYECSFTCTFNHTGGFGNDTAWFRHCMFNGAVFTLSAAAAETLNFYESTFKSASNDSNIFDVGDTDPRLRFFNCVLENGKLNFSVANIKTILVNTVIRNSTGTNCIATSSTPTVFLGNFTSDKTLAAGVAQAAGSFNVQTAMAI